MLAGDSPSQGEYEFKQIALQRLIESAEYALNALKEHSKLKRANAIQKLEDALAEMKTSMPNTPLA